jgi:hypothetical protein
MVCKQGARTRQVRKVTDSNYPPMEIINLISLHLQYNYTYIGGQGSNKQEIKFLPA